MNAPIRIPLSVPSLGDADIERVAEAIRVGWVSSGGPQVVEFERAIASTVGVRHAVATTNGTAAIHLACLAAGIGPGDAVVVPALTFIGTANPVRYCGATVVIADVREQDGTLDADLLRDYLTSGTSMKSGVLIDRASGAPLKAVLPVHLFGAPADMSAILRIGREHGLVVIEDAAEALGSHVDGRPLGSFGAVGCLSFNGNKIITTGGGGMVVSDDDGLARRARHLGTQARTSASEYTHDAIGFNYRLTNLQAALGLSQLDTLDSRVAHKQEIAAFYRRRLAGLPLRFLEPTVATSNHWLTAIVLDDASLRPVVAARLAAAGIEVRPFFVPLHRLAPYVGSPQACAPTVAEDLHARGLNLPSSPGLSLEDAETVATALETALH